MTEVGWARPPMVPHSLEDWNKVSEEEGHSEMDEAMILSSEYGLLTFAAMGLDQTTSLFDIGVNRWEFLRMMMWSVHRHPKSHLKSIGS